MKDDCLTEEGVLEPASEAARAPVPVSEAAGGLRVAFDLLLQDMALEPVDPGTLPWNQPILVLRSAPMDRLLALLDQILVHCPAPALHILSHARDEPTIRDWAPCAFTFHAYPTPGRYQLEQTPRPMLDHLRAVRFGTLFYIDSGSADLFREVESIFEAIQDHGMISVGDDGTFGRTPNPRLRRQAESAFLGLIEWYQRKLEQPNGRTEH
jgi:hypothetical protein